MVVGGEI